MKTDPKNPAEVTTNGKQLGEIQAVLPTVKLETTWYELLGEKRADISDSERRKRWEAWKQLADTADENEMLEYWTDISACEDCIHRDGDWCTVAELPVTINPILTMQHGLIGMACKGVGYRAPKNLRC